MVKKLFSPAFVSTLLLIIFLFCGFKIPDKYHLKSLIPLSSCYYIKGKLISSPYLLNDGKGYGADLKVTSLSLKNNSKFSAKGIIKIIIPAILIEQYFPGKLKTVSKKNNADIIEEGGEYTFSGIGKNTIFYADNFIESNWNNSFLSKIYKIRALLRLHFKRLMYKWKEAGGLFLALISGSREYLNQEVSDNFKKAGLSHILALSGMHLSLLSGIAKFIGDKIKRIRVSYLIRILAISMFVFFAGFSPSLLRAFISSILILLFSIINEDKPELLLIVSISFIIQINLKPSDISNLGFQLSYGALFGIILFNNFFQKIYNWFLPNFISGSFSSSSSAQLLTTPISLKIFNKCYPIGIFSSVVVSPLVTYYIYIGLILLIITLIFPFLSDISAFIMNLLYTIIKNLVNLFSGFPGISIKE